MIQILKGYWCHISSNTVFLGRVAAGTENGTLYIGHLEPPGDSNGSGGNSTFETHHIISDDGIAALSFSPDGSMLAIGSQDSTIYILVPSKEAENNQSSEAGESSGLLKLTGHSAGISHIDWSNDNHSLRSNSIDYELLYWKIKKLNDNEGKNTQLS